MNAPHLLTLGAWLLGSLFFTPTLVKAAPALLIDQPSSWADQKVHVQATGLVPGSSAQLTLASHDLFGGAWSSQATYLADTNGVIDPSTQAPLFAPYLGADAMGLFWSMHPEQGDAGTYFFLPTLPKTTYNLTLSVDQKIVASGSIVRGFYDDSKIEVRQIDEAGVYATFFAPRDGKPHPTVVFLGGFEGNVQAHFPALLTKYGFTVLSVGYTGGELGHPKQLPQDLIRIPVERVGAALTWLQKQPQVNAADLRLIGFSRGSELALLSANHYAGAFKQIVLASPSAVVWQGSLGPSVLPQAAWTWQGQDVPFQSVDFWPIDFAGFAPYSFFRAFASTYAFMQDDNPAFLDVSRLNLPALFIAGDEDAAWPALEMATRLQKNWPQATRLAHFVGAGHNLNLPYLPALAYGTPTIRLGGTPAANTVANEQEWSEIVHFLTTP